jgi:hypothetical protein
MKGNNRFNFEDLEVWQKAVEFSKLVIDIAEFIGIRIASFLIFTMNYEL